MRIEIGQVEAIFRYPVKSKFRRVDDCSGMPWLTASKLPDLLLFAPQRREDGAEAEPPAHIRAPDGQAMPVFGKNLASEVGDVGMGLPFR